MNQKNEEENTTTKDYRAMIRKRATRTSGLRHYVEETKQGRIMTLREKVERGVEQKKEKKSEEK